VDFLWKSRHPWSAGAHRLIDPSAVAAADLGRNLEHLHDRVQRIGHCIPSSHIPKPDSRARLTVAALADKIVQRAVVTLLNAIYEAISSGKHGR
jgi:hypothetical protein